MGTDNVGTGLNTNQTHNGDHYHISFRQEELREANQALRRAQRELNDQVQQSNQLVAQMRTNPSQNLSKEQRDNIASHTIVLNKAKEVLKHDVTEYNSCANHMSKTNRRNRGNTHTAEQKANVELMILSAEKNLAALEAGNCSIRAINHELKQAIGHINTNQTTNQMTSNNTAMNNTDNTHFRGTGRRNHTRNNMDQTSVNNTGVTQNTGLNTGTDFNNYNNNHMSNFDNMQNNTAFSSASNTTNTTDTTNQNQTNQNTTDGMTGTHNITPRHNTGRHTGTTNTSGTTMGYAQLCKKGC
jgi:hypothetical protein